MSNDFKVGTIGICSVVIAIIAAITITVNYSTVKISDMVQSGADPIAASCAINDPYGDNPTCVLVSSKEPALVVPEEEVVEGDEICETYVNRSWF